MEESGDDEDEQPKKRKPARKSKEVSDEEVDIEEIDDPVVEVEPVVKKESASVGNEDDNQNNRRRSKRAPKRKQSPTKVATRTSAKLLKIEIQPVEEDDAFMDYEEVVEPEELEGTEMAVITKEEIIEEEQDDNDFYQDPDDADYVFDDDGNETEDNFLNGDSEDDYGENREHDPLDGSKSVSKVFINCHVQ